MARNTNKKLFAGLLALSVGFVLASCSPVSAVPVNYSKPIVTSTDGDINVEENILGKLYDDVAGDRNSKIVSDLLAEIAEKKFGTYKEYLDSKDSNEKRDEYISNHSDFFGTDENKVNRYEDFSSDIDQRISSFFYNEITGGSYKDELGRFSEKKFYDARRYELFDLADGTEFKTFYVSKQITKDNAFEVGLTPEYYNVVEGDKHGYIKEKVFPDILKNKLVEDYIYKNNASSLGRAYGREISFVKVSYEKDHTNTWKMLKKFAKSYIEDDAHEKINFDILQDVINGFTVFDENDASGNHDFVNALYGKTPTAVVTPASYNEQVALLLQEEYGNPDTSEGGNMVVVDYSKPGYGAEQYKYIDQVLIPEGAYYKETKLGKIVENYNKAIKAENANRFPLDEDKTALDSFTADGKSKQYGLLQQLLPLVKEDITTDGWFVKNGGANELPSAIRDRLFNIRVANTFDDENKLPVETGSGYNTVDTPYLRNVKGNKVVLPSKSLSFEEDPYNYIYHDKAAKAYYICQVLEAPSTSKLTDKSDAYEPYKKEQIKRQIAKILGTKDSYIKDAYTEYLDKYEFAFNDTSLYEYLKAEYPDLHQFQD